MIKVTIRPSDGPEQSFSANKQMVIVGRGSNCDLVVVAEGVSRQHLKIETSRTGVCYVTDLGSTNGTLLDGKRLKPNTPTPYAPFHSLSIGTIPSVSIETGVSAQRTLSAYRMLLRKDDLNPEIQLDIPQEQISYRVNPETGEEEEESVPAKTSSLANILAILIVIGVTYYIFMG